METSLDEVDLGILWNRLISIVEEATAVQYRTSFSTVVQEANDYACSILSSDGTTLANSQAGLPSFVHTQSVTTQHLLREYADEFEEGTVFVTNDSWIATGHCMDITIIRPIILGGRLVAFAGSVAHSPDLGGTVHWNRSDDIYTEGLSIPVTKLLSRGIQNDTLISLIRANSRIPDLTIGDIEAQLAATLLIETRIRDLLRVSGLADLDGPAASIFERCEQLMRDAISNIPDGSYSGEVLCDTPGSEPSEGHPEPLTIRCRVIVEADEMSVDFRDSSKQIGGSFNSVGSFTAGYVLYALRLILVPLHPNNGGFYRPIRILSPDGTVANVSFPSPTLSRHVLGHQTVDAVYSALAEVLPEGVFAQSGSAPCWDLILSGTDHAGRPFHRLIILNGGTGASMSQEGQTLGFPANLRNTPVEVAEALMPLLWESKAVRRGSGGAGLLSGGPGQRVSLRVLEGEVQYSLLGARVAHPAKGLLGGDSGAPGAAFVDGASIPVPTDGVLEAGQVLTIDTPGGGGIGNASR